jgi:glucose uptake protein GlcU
LAFVQGVEEGNSGASPFDYAQGFAWAFGRAEALRARRFYGTAEAVPLP